MAIYFTIDQMISWPAFKKGCSLTINPYEGRFHDASRARLKYWHLKVQKKTCMADSHVAPSFLKLCANKKHLMTGASNTPNGGFFHESAEWKATSPSLAESVDHSKYEDVSWPSADDEIPFWKKEFSSCQSVSNPTSNVKHDSDLMHIVHVTAEIAPIAKVGGLGDVVTGLARACLNRGHKVEVMLPFYECIKKEQVNDLTLSDTYSSYHNGSWVPTCAYRGLVSGIPLILIEPTNHFFKGQRVYGGSYDELEAYLFFSRACLELMQVTSTQPDIIHIHEWQTSGLSLLYWDMYHHLSVKKPRIVLTIHNMEHYGECRKEQLAVCGLDGSVYSSIDKALDDRTIGHNPERLSLLKGGVVYSNAVTTVSPTYVNETLCSGWLSNILMQYRPKYSGILNGIDTVLWDPSTDVFLPAHFHANELKGKQICKQYVQRGLGLSLHQKIVSSQDADEAKLSPLVVCITRLVAQKGLHLIRYAINRVAELGGQFILLGTAPEGKLQEEFEHLSHLYRESDNVRLLLMYSEELSHMLYAAADIVLVPSMYEPCGLAQMIGMRYGAVPVVRRTGGLADTVFDVDHQLNSAYQGNGYVFDGIDEGSLNGALERAFLSYNEKPELWTELVSRIMKIDNSWNKSAGEYIQLYNSIRARC